MAGADDEGDGPRRSWVRFMVHVTGDPKAYGADRDRRWLLIMLGVALVASLALMGALLVRDLSVPAAAPQAVPARR